jgi:glycosyltransferase involved in cell wall biosynthesis
MHYCFMLYGSWEGNAGFIRPRHLGAQLVERGVRVTYVVDDVPYNRASLDLHPRASVAYVPNSRGLRQIPARRRVVREVAPDYMHLLNPHAKSFAALAGVNDVKVVVDWDEPPFTKDYGFARNLLEKVIDRWLRSRADLNIACTTWVKQYFQEHYGMDLPYIPHAPYLSQYADGTSPFVESTVVYMGNYYPIFDHDIIFDAAVLLKRAGMTPPILMMGSGPDIERWRAFVAKHELKNVTIAGYVSGEDLWRRLRHAHVLLFPIRPTLVNQSRCPSKVFAYAQARRPIITSRVGELPYMLGESPLYVEPTPQAFADAIRAAMGGPLPDVPYHLEHHTWGARADRLLEALKTIA